MALLPIARKNKSEIIAAILKPLAVEWTVARVREMIVTGVIPENYISAMMKAVVMHPSLTTVSDDEFIAGIELISPDFAKLFRTPGGLDWMHHAADKLSAKSILSLFGG